MSRAYDVKLALTPAGATMDEVIEEYYRKVDAIEKWRRSPVAHKRDLTAEEEAEKRLVEAYEDAVDDFEVHYPRFGAIFDTKYRWEVPYLIDVEKYKAVVNTELSDEQLRSLRLSAHFWGMHCNQVLNFTFYSWSSQDDEDDTCNQYDCLQYGEYNGAGRKSYEEFKAKVMAVTDCIIGVDTEALDEIVELHLFQIKHLEAENDLIEQIKKEK